VYTEKTFLIWVGRCYGIGTFSVDPIYSTSSKAAKYCKRPAPVADGTDSQQGANLYLFPDLEKYSQNLVAVACAAGASRIPYLCHLAVQEGA
jgi:hypothetical protein